jgi:hypothetical protein
MSESNRSEEIEAEGSEGGNLFTDLVEWFKEVAWEYDSREPTIRATDFHNYTRLVSWVMLAIIGWRLIVLFLAVVADVQPIHEFALEANEDGIRTAMLYVVGGVILIPFGLFLSWVFLKFLWNVSLSIVRSPMARILHPIAIPIVGIVWLQILFVLRGYLAVMFWASYYSIRHTLELASKFAGG